MSGRLSKESPDLFCCKLKENPCVGRRLSQRAHNIFPDALEAHLRSKEAAYVAKECVEGNGIGHAMGIPQNCNPDHSVFTLANMRYTS